ncbi:anaerobic coproporphyrinogen III oxidase [Haloactinopolyspora alba]|uniref:Heme chaperone HemW n=1 Tax=Haloactinopolyspora alba TaxID=648780 RepID=A0A2P8EBR2_9ACTN|nr:radical SAM family heme chaperone HemW [Haloactinopolyspora alba]PSL06919.1 anaerobic coproporphyrinogen III oxidase [Haloactinopolyspora alba]
MPSTLPDGAPAPVDGTLPASALNGVGDRPFGIYLHVPFCTTRCGYCDFNTYTATELGTAPGASRSTWADGATAELRLARRALGAADVEVSTVFVGGGTPTLLPPSELARVLDVVDGEFGLAHDAEVTTEANPESVSKASLDELRAAGFTRVSVGMQSARPHVLSTLDRVHTPGRPARAAADAYAAGFEHVSLDLIYGTPGESLDDWRASLETALESAPDHVSAYALIVEEGTALAARMARGELPMPDDDDQADKYLLADDLLAAAGYDWYELSNWATMADARCRHNELYWTGADWWGVGPGAHSHVGGTRWWNVKHPAAWAGRLSDGSSPAYAREILDAATRRTERVLLEVRLAGGLDLGLLDDDGRRAAEHAVERGLGAADAFAHGRLVLTRQGRLLADAVVRDLLG